ncbi:hypothetical protein AAFC00_000335 [Neodothiora populina]|uniref:Malic enzyme n=1 Tax=Neodothiora populina TaxID=2781224 RepID=A0ABR3PCK7_9PEZI
MTSNKFNHLPLATNKPLDCALTGNALLNSPYLNKGSAFTVEEREKFELSGLLPTAIDTLDTQTRRAYAQYSTRPSDLAKNTFLSSLQYQNQVLFYKVIQTHLREMFPVVYTPTEGDAISDYSRVFRRPEGCFLSVNQPEKVEQDISQWGSSDDIDLIVVSDGEQILGIGDQGVGGILISVAKLVLYTLCAGIHPHRTLPVVLDCGTNNEKLLKDDLYLGNRHERVRGEKYDKLVNTFIQAARKKYPKAYIHFEDFGLPNARRILDKYTPQIACFNDDVQGTGAVTLAAIYAALKVAQLDMKDVRILMYGAGTAGTGIADQVADAIAEEADVHKDEAIKQIWCVDKPGVLLESMKDDLTPAQHPYARPDSEWTNKKHDDLLGVVKEVKPHILIGTSTKPKAFTEEVVKEMAKHTERPIIFPLSNPTKLHEANPADIFKWTEGKALIATGSPFDPVEHNGTKYEVAECNNSTTFPGIGLGAVLSRTKLLSPPLIVAAVKALAAQAPALQDSNAGLLPDIADVREISVKIAAAVIKKAVEEKLAQQEGIPDNDKELDEWIRAQMWDPEYRELRKVEPSQASPEAKGEAGSKGGTKKH